MWVRGWGARVCLCGCVRACGCMRVCVWGGVRARVRMRAARSLACTHISVACVWLSDMSSFACRLRAARIACCSSAIADSSSASSCLWLSRCRRDASACVCSIVRREDGISLVYIISSIYH